MTQGMSNHFRRVEGLIYLAVQRVSQGSGVSGRIPVRFLPPYNLPECNIEPLHALLEAVLR